jgi:CubicO group peptidase (beta-lactamase class C family)
LHASEGFGAQLDLSEERKVKRQREPIAAVQASRRRAITAILVLVCIVLPQLARAQGDVAPGNRALKAAVAKLVQETGIKPGEPGIAVLALKPGRVLLMEGYGLANIASKEAITSCTRFELASVSKTFTSTAILILQERGLLSIDDDVRKYIPELPQYPNGPLRLRDLLSTSPASPTIWSCRPFPRATSRIGSTATTLRRWARRGSIFRSGKSTNTTTPTACCWGSSWSASRESPTARFCARTYSLPWE